MYHGDISLGDTLDIKFTTVNSSGVPATLSGTPVVSAYPGNSTTQLTAGITLSVDFDLVTGLNNVRVVASSGNGYAAGTNYALVITTGTVDVSSVVGYVVGSFSIANRSNLTAAEVNAEVDTALAGYDGPTKAELDAGLAALNDLSQAEAEAAVDAALENAIPATPTSGSINEVLKRLKRSVDVIQQYTVDTATFTPTTTQCQVDAVDIGSLEGTNDHFIGRVMIFTSGDLIYQATEITDYDGTNKRFSFTALTEPPGDNDTFIVV